MTQDDELSYDASVIGVEVETGQFSVDEAHIQAFCAALGETNPLYTDPEVAARGQYGGIVAPPVFYGVVRVGGGLDAKVRYGNASFLAGQHCEFNEPIRPGDTITAKTKVHEIYEKSGRTGRMVFLVRRTTFRNQDGETVATVDNSLVYRKIER